MSLTSSPIASRSVARACSITSGATRTSISESCPPYSTFSTLPEIAFGPVPRSDDPKGTQSRAPAFGAHVDYGRETVREPVRLALGATRGRVLWMVLRQVAGIALAGLAVGVPAALAAGPLLRSLLFGLGPTDAPTLGIAAVTLLSISASFFSRLPAFSCFSRVIASIISSCSSYHTSVPQP